MTPDGCLKLEVRAGEPATHNFTLSVIKSMLPIFSNTALKSKLLRSSKQKAAYEYCVSTADQSKETDPCIVSSIT